MDDLIKTSEVGVINGQVPVILTGPDGYRYRSHVFTGQDGERYVDLAPGRKSSVLVRALVSMDIRIRVRKW